ncbi:MAG: glycosyltransferase family 2 protein [Bacteroidia bacterium]|nr:glycosyltransferase family 2 protein [Bacteroidia bacterium]
MTNQPQPPQINIVVPLYNEEASFPELVKRLTALMDSEPLRITAILVDDGSRDATPRLMRQLALNDERFQAVFLSRNFGHQLALTAGLSYIDATEAVLIIDGDLQDPPELLGRFYTELKNGYDVVYAVREKRKENFVKRTAYNAFYKILKRISYIDIPLDSGDFSLISRQVADELNQMPEASRFVRGMRSWVGFNQIGIPYERTGRAAGQSKYTLRKLLGLALNGIFNFSEYPIKFITTLGILTISSSVIYFLVTLIKKLVYDTVPEGFSALLFVIILFGGVQLIAIGIIGEYILRIFFQVKNRPLFIVRHVIKNRQEQNG